MARHCQSIGVEQSTALSKGASGSRQISASLLESVAVAVEQQRICSLFQPIVRLSDNSLAGFEVLSRWTNEKGEVVSPAEFIPAAESAGVLDDLFLQQLRCACSILKQEKGLCLSFNISSQQSLRPRLPEQVAAVLNECDFPASRIRLEITEDALFQYTEDARCVVMRLRDMGVGIVMDDFGTGSSSLSRLRTLPFTSIKIDASFVRRLCEEKLSREIVAATLKLGHGLELCVVAEGVETEEQASLLARMGCQFGQGFLFSKGVYAHQLSSFLNTFTLGEKVRATGLLSEALGPQAEALYRSKMVGVAYVGADGMVLNVNRYFADRVQAPVENILHRPAQEVFPYVIPSFMPARFESDAIGKVQSGVVEVVWKDGRIDAISIEPICDEEDRIVAYSLLGFDITDQKNLERCVGKVGTELLSYGPPQEPQTSAAVVPSFSTECTLRGNVPFICSSVNGSRTLAAVLDTSASLSMVSPLVAEELRLISFKTARRSPHFAGFLGGVSLRLESEGLHCDLPNQELAVLSTRGTSETLGEKVEALCGSNWFRNFAVITDLYDGSIAFEPFPHTLCGYEQQVEIDVQDQMPFVYAVIRTMEGNPLRARFLLSTATPEALVFSKEFAMQCLSLTPSKYCVALPKVAEPGGGVDVAWLRLRSIALGNEAESSCGFLASPIAVVREWNSGFFRRTPIAGIIGAEVLRRFRILWNYKELSIALKRQPSFDEPFPVDRSGLLLAVHKPTWQQVFVQAVLPDSPASAAGFCVGDVIRSLDGEENLALWKMRQKLCSAATSIEVSWQSEGDVRQGKLLLKDILQ